MESTDEDDDENKTQNILKQAFTRGDRNNDNLLDLNELTTVLKNFNINMHKKQINDILANVLGWKQRRVANTCNQK